MAAHRRSSQRQRQRAAKAQPATATTAQNSAPVEVPKPSRTKSNNDTINMVATFGEVLSAIESLYEDGLKPFGRILRKRVAELAAIASGMDSSCEANLPHVDIKELLYTCESSDRLRVEPEEGGDWSVLIVGRTETFINVYSPDDPYPTAMWSAAAEYFQTLAEVDMHLPGGRYSCAQALQARCLSFLQGHSLGQVCHIVQLAISKKKILGYLNGSVVPYFHSQSMVKESCAVLKAPCTGNAGVPAAPSVSGGTILTMATWEIARGCLRDILQNSASAGEEPGALGTVPLSNVKRLFRSRFQTELSETLLGHSKLSELLQDERFGDICFVELQGNGYTVIQVQPKMDGTGNQTTAREAQTEAAAEQSYPQQTLMLDASMASDLVESSPSPKCRKTWWRPPSGDGLESSIVQRTFIHASLPPPTPEPNARRRSASLSKDFGSQTIWEPVELKTRRSETASTIDSSSGSAAQGMPSRSPTPSDSCRSSDALEDPVKLLLRKWDLGATTQTIKIGDAADEDSLDEDEEPNRRPAFCLDEPLSLDEAGFFFEPAPYMQTPTSVYGQPSPAWWPYLSPSVLDSCVGCAAPPKVQNTWPCLSPSLLEGCVGSIALSKVHNTFIHSPLPPPTPLRGDASRRSCSLPKNIGSNKNAWEVTCQALGFSHLADSVQCEPVFNASVDSLPTPSVYAGYSGYDSPAYVPGFASSPSFVPPSPALTASPTYCSRRPFRSGAHRPFHFGDHTPTSSYSRPLSPLGGPGQVAQQPTSGIIRLAELLR